VDKLEEGQLIQGTVIEVSNEFVFIDVGYKSEGKIPIAEFQKIPQLGDKVNVILIYKEGRNGQVIVSKRKADELEFYQMIRKCYKEHLPVKAKIVKAIKGGFEANLQDFTTALVPLSQIDTKKVEDTESYIGMEGEFYIERLLKGGQRKLVLSRRAWLEDKNRLKQEDFFKTKKVGDIVEGKVKSFTSFGAFIDLGGFDGLLHNSDLGWSKTVKPKEILHKDEKIQLKIVNLDQSKRKINLSLKEMSENPWHTFEKRYEVGDIVKGKITKLVDYGAFIELEAGIEGLLHISELSWVKKVRHPKDLLKVNDPIEVKIIDFDLQNEKVSLSLKHILPNPWDDLETRYPKGSRIKRTVKNLTASGAFLEIEEGIDGFLHIDDISWTQNIKEAKEVVKSGDEVEVMIVNIDKENKKIRLGLKQLSEDPWQALTKIFTKGSLIEGKVTAIKDTGIEVEVQGGIEGFIKRSQICDPTLEKAEEVLARCKVGDRITAVIIELIPKRKKLGLSLREYTEKQHAQEIEKYLHDEKDQIGNATLGEILKEKEAR
jgi:small subunit ribosomal protein S1